MIMCLVNQNYHIIAELHVMIQQFVTKKWSRNRKEMVRAKMVQIYNTGPVFFAFACRKLVIFGCFVFIVDLICIL